MWLGADHEELLAGALGISVEELQAAQTKAQEAALDQAVADGWITQRQADQMKLYGFRWLGRGLELWGAGIDRNALLAEALGISVDDLAAAQEKAYTTWLAQEVEAGRLTQEQADQMQAEHDLRLFLASRLQTAYTEGIQAAVEAGVITQEQADQIQSGPGWGASGLFGRRLFGGGLWDGGLFGRDGFGRRPGRGPMGGGMFGPGEFGRGGHGRGGWAMPGDATPPDQPGPEDEATPQDQSTPSQPDAAGIL
jgi:hypothetical protein